MPEKISGILFTANFKSLNFKNQRLMQELIEKLKAEAGLTDEQAKKAIETIKSYVVEKFPMLEGAVGNLFGS
jgi:glycyl-tRNA synthetase beta subunit